VAKGEAGRSKKTSGKRAVARPDEEDAPVASPSSNERAKRAFLFATPFTMLILLGIGGYLYTLPEPKKEERIVVNVDDLFVAPAMKKYDEAFKVYKEGLPLEGAPGAAKLRQAKELLFAGQELMNQARAKCDEIDAGAGKKPDPNDHHYYPFEDKAQKIDLLIEDCNKQLREKL
jgi:hypothetical protein